MTPSRIATCAGGLATAVVCALALLGPAAAAQTEPPVTSTTDAANSFGFAVRPYADAGGPTRDWFTYNLKPGDTVTDRVSIVNGTDQPKELLLYTRDAYNTSVSGGFALNLRTEAVHDAGGWVSLPVERYTVPAHMAAIMPVTITVPPDAAPGDHVAGIIGEEIKPDSSETAKGTGFRSIHRVAARVYVRVAGPARPELTVEKVHVSHDDPVLPHFTGTGSMTVSYTIKNTGNVILQPQRLEVAITGLFGRNLHQYALVRPKPDPAHPATSPIPDQLLPGNSVVFTKTWAELPPIDHVTVHVRATATQLGSTAPVRTERTVGVWIVPWAVLLVIAIVLTLLYWRRRRRLHDDLATSAPTPPNDPAGDRASPVSIGA